jgi:hypothetical protein
VNRTVPFAVTATRAVNVRLACSNAATYGRGDLSARRRHPKQRN